MFLENGEVKEFFCVDWNPIAKLGVKIADPAFQTFWEFLTLALCLLHWASLFEDLLVCGDNTASLSMAMSLKCKGVEVAIARELAWRRARFGWTYAVAHLPAEANVLADTLSRVADPNRPKLVSQPSALLGAAEVKVSVDALWSLPQDSF